jgi:hypothetical protein
MLHRLIHTPEPVSVKKIDMRTMHIDIPTNLNMPNTNKYKTYQQI